MLDGIFRLIGWFILKINISTCRKRCSSIWAIIQYIILHFTIICSINPANKVNHFKRNAGLIYIVYRYYNWTLFQPRKGVLESVPTTPWLQHLGRDSTSSSQVDRTEQGRISIFLLNLPATSLFEMNISVRRSISS